MIDSLSLFDDYVPALPIVGGIFSFIGKLFGEAAKTDEAFQM